MKNCGQDLERKEKKNEKIKVENSLWEKLIGKLFLSQLRPAPANNQFWDPNKSGLKHQTEKCLGIKRKENSFGRIFSFVKKLHRNLYSQLSWSFLTIKNLLLNLNGYTVCSTDIPLF